MHNTSAAPSNMARAAEAQALYSRSVAHVSAMLIAAGLDPGLYQLSAAPSVSLRTVDTALILPPLPPPVPSVPPSPPPPPWPPASPPGLCNNACNQQVGRLEGVCEDGGAGSEFSMCPFGTDCTCLSCSNACTSPPLPPLLTWLQPSRVRRLLRVGAGDDCGVRVFCISCPRSCQDANAAFARRNQLGATCLERDYANRICTRQCNNLA
jgi:hypothetical protein